jgi:Predicted metal-sulfur cluster biosynthetic enzyme
MLDQSHAIETLRGVIDPDIGLNIVDLGLVESVEATPGGLAVALIMTTPACPQSGYIEDECARLLRRAGGGDVAVHTLELPLWDPGRLSDSAKAALGWGG